MAYLGYKAYPGNTITADGRWANMGMLWRCQMRARQRKSLLNMVEVLNTSDTHNFQRRYCSIVSETLGVKALLRVAPEAQPIEHE